VTTSPSAIRILVCAAAVGLLAACSSSKPVKVVTLTVPATKPAASPSTPSTTTGADGSGSAAPGTPTGTTSQLTTLSGTCDTLLPDYAISQAIGGVQIAGTDAFVVGKAEPGIGRIGYLNCRYGVTGTGAAAKPKIEVGISLYSTAEQAASRIRATADDYTGHGATASQTPVNGQTATMLTDGAGAGYDVPLLVVSSGQRTVAVGVADSLASGAKAPSYAAAIATLALRRTGG
jgi:hypothetical protein